ncbi:MAG: hypothetical protein ACP5D5_07665 [Acidithiobacillus sp.]|uniref:hypothetical protein n=1 Tax=Acidithiobacillus sp. TaxID=1872118 RepID=UPI0025B7F33A|nr:hypothetical protein [Acidithiobacillus sp.]
MSLTPPHIAERLQIAILTSEQMRLHWEDPDSGMHYYERVLPVALESSGDGDLLRCRLLDEDREIQVPVARIRNLPTPVK